ncbi:MAG: DUF4340 domain-containing protein, partial [Myxococcales bacterium]|nr:DUF4340 domain-containing protein [Myxococcales bacterium]
MKIGKPIVILVGLVVVLAVVFFVVKKDDAPPATPDLTIKGFATPEQLAEDKARKLLEGPLEIPAPVDGVELVKDGETIVLARSGEGKDATWKITAPVDAVAVKYVADKITALFRTDAASAFSTRIKPGDEALYDLEPERRIGLKLTKGGEVWEGVDLWIGRLEKSDDMDGGGEPDTWVMKKDDPTVVYRVAGRDLRAAVDVSLDTLRDKKLFAFDANDMTEISVTTPEGAVATLTGTRKETPAEASPEDGAKPEGEKKPPVVTVDWKLTAPAGVAGDASVASLARSFANLRAKEFVKAKDAGDKPLGETPWRVSATVGGEKVTLLVSAAAGEDVMAQVEGKDEYAKLQRYSADGLLKTVEDLRDKTVLGTSAESIGHLKLALEGGGEVVLDRKPEGGWVFTSPASPYAADPGTLTTTISRLAAVRWARPGEVAEARAALATPDIAGEVGYGEKLVPLAFAKKMEGGEHDGQRWAVAGDPATADPFLVTDYNATRFVAKLADLRQKRLFPGLTQEGVQRVTVLAPGATAPVELGREKPGQDITLLGAPAGKTVQAGPVRTIVSTVAALQAKDFVDGKSAAALGLEGEQVTKVTVTDESGKTATLVIGDTSGEG